MRQMWEAQRPGEGRCCTAAACTRLNGQRIQNIDAIDSDNAAHSGE